MNSVPFLSFLFPCSLSWAVACSDYGFNRPEDITPPEAGDPPAGDSADPQDTGGDAPPDSDEPSDSDAPQDSGLDDECYDPSSAYDMHPAAGLVVTQTLDIATTYVGSDAGFTSELYLSSPVTVYLGTGHVTAAGTVSLLGSFDPGTELVFSIHVTDNGNVYYSGPSSRNADDFNHAAITYAGDCVWLVGFEDEYGGGDQDFNDIEFSISGPLEMQLVE